MGAGRGGRGVEPARADILIFFGLELGLVLGLPRVEVFVLLLLSIGELLFGTCGIIKEHLSSWIMVSSKGTRNIL